MNINKSRALITVISLMACLASYQLSALESQGPRYSFNGFGTLGVVYSDEDEADFVSSWFLQPNGAGHTSKWHAGIDTKLGGQLNARFNDRFSTVIQAVLERQEDNAWTPSIEWANIQYHFSDTFSLRIGRTMLAPFMVSDTRLVGYANHWIRPPQELYQVIPLTNLDGLNVIYNRDFGSWRNTLQLTYGQTDQDLVHKAELQGREAIILSNSLEYGFATFHLGYLSAKIHLYSPASSALFSAYDDLGNTLAFIAGLEDAAVQASAINERYSLDDTAIEVFSTGLRLEPGNWLFMAEWARNTEANILQKSEAWYASLGYRFNTVTPYLTLAEVNGDTSREPGVTTSGMPPSLATVSNTLNETLNQVLSLGSPAQKSITVGIRWDFASNTALKLQYQHIELDENSSGRLVNTQPAFEPGNRANTFSAVINFVF